MDALRRVQWLTRRQIHCNIVTLLAEDSSESNVQKSNGFQPSLTTAGHSFNRQAPNGAWT
jgi:hypothetical protein